MKYDINNPEVRSNFVKILDAGNNRVAMTSSAFTKKGNKYPP